MWNIDHLVFGAPKAGGAIGNRNSFLLRDGRHQQVVMPALSVIQMGYVKLKQYAFPRLFWGLQYIHFSGTQAPYFC